MIRQHDLLLSLIVLALLGMGALHNEAFSSTDLAAPQGNSAVEVGRVFCAATMIALDTDANEQLTAAEVRWSSERFAAVDRDRDGVISRVELTIIGAADIAQAVNAAGLPTECLPLPS